MKIAVTGSTGLIGSALVEFLTAGGHEILRVVRSMPRNPEREMQWDPENGMIDPKRLEGCDAVVHLAGENIGNGRWTSKRKARIRDSRIEGTRILCEALAQLDAPPKALISASAIGYYGDRGDQWLDESRSPGSGFLPDVCRLWEAATEPAQEKGIRVVQTRTGVVLSPAGGALAKMLTPFKLGGGGVIGSGQQYWSWIALDDVVGAIDHALNHDDLSGPTNVAAPNPATNQEFTKTLGKVLGRPTIVPMPAAVARLVLGEMADELLLASARVVPAKLQQSGYTFRFPELKEALRHVLGKTK